MEKYILYIKASIAIYVSKTFKKYNNRRQRKSLCNNKGSNQQEDITFINIYTSNIRAPKYMKQILTDIRGQIDSNRIIVTLTPH